MATHLFKPNGELNMKHGFYALAFALLMTSCVREEMTEVQQDKTDFPAVENASIYVPGEMKVKFSEELTAMIEEDLAVGNLKTRSSALNVVMEELGVVSMTRLCDHGGEFEAQLRRNGMHRWYQVCFSESQSHTKAAADFSKISGVEIVEPVRRIVRKDFTGYNDPYFGYLWGFNNAGRDINVTSVWQNYTTGNPNVIVAVMDGGVDLKHEDLQYNIGPSSMHLNTTGPSTVDAETHGTHVAGTVAATGNNGKGVVGVAGGDYAAGQKGVTIMACQILSEQPNRRGNYYNAMVHATHNGAVISQNSWGYNYDFDGDGQLTGDERIMALNATIDASDKDAVDYFIRYAGCDSNGNQRSDSPMKGGVVIFAAGNESIENGAPANYDAVIAVGAINSYGGRADFSNYGDWVDICAPGTAILSTVPGGYEELQGTSMACPHVSGVAALVLSYCGGQGFTNDMLKEKILSSTNKDMVPPSYKIGGLVDAHKAIAYGDNVDPGEIKDLSVNAVSNNIDFSVTVTADSEGVPNYGYRVLYDTNRSRIESATIGTANVGSASFAPGLEVGETADFRISDLQFNTTYYLKVYTYTYGMNYSQPSEVYTVTTGTNTAPTVSFDVTQEECQLSAADVLVFNINAVDPDGHTLTLEHTPGSDADVVTRKSDGSWIMTITANAAEIGTYTTKVKVTDAYGLYAEATLEYTILPNSAPEVIAAIEDILLAARGKEFTLDMADYVEDPDQDASTLNYDIQISNGAVLHIVPRQNILYGTALGYGATEVTVVVTDARGEKCTLAFRVVVKNPAEPVSLYPNPVVDYLNVSTMDIKDTRVRIVSQTGQTVYDKVSKIGAFEPAKIDMRGCAPGVYSVSVTFDGKETRQNIVKL